MFEILFSIGAMVACARGGESMRIGAGLSVICMLISEGGCNIVPQQYQLAAEPLIEMDKLPDTTIAFVQSSASSPPEQSTVALTNIERISLLVQDSQTKCAHFVDSLFAQTAGSGFVLDLLSTATSALATVFTPLPTVHSLTASSTIFGAAKTGISANYLNTLSISHVTQAIQSTYTTDMQKYIGSLYAAEPLKLNVFQERSKIVSYHNECSLAAAEGSISGALQSTAPAGQGLQVIHKVVAGENTPELLAAALAKDINGTFSKAGITATASGSVISLRMVNPVTLTVSSSPPGLVQYVAGPPGLLAIKGTPHTGDTVTIAGPPATQPSTGGAQPSGGAQTAPAAISGQSPALK
jgi:hypothetical protein